MPPASPRSAIASPTVIIHDLNGPPHETGGMLTWVGDGRRGEDEAGRAPKSGSCPVLRLRGRCRQAVHLGVPYVHADGSPDLKRLPKTLQSIRARFQRRRRA